MNASERTEQDILGKEESPGHGVANLVIIIHLKFTAYGLSFG